MATKLEKKGYGQIELNHVAFRRDGRIEAQSKLDETDFAEKLAENGMLLVVDFANRKVKFPTAELLAHSPVAVNYTTEKQYEWKNQLKDFATGLDDFLPRLGYLAVGDKFTTNTVAYDFESPEALDTALDGIGETAVYGGLTADAETAGYIVLSASQESFLENSPVFRVVEKTTMPDGQRAVKLQVIKA